MFKHIFILIVSTVLSQSAISTETCRGLFQRPDSIPTMDSVQKLVHSLRVTLDVKRRLFLQMKHNKPFRTFVYLYFSYMDNAVENKFADIVNGKISFKIGDSAIKQDIIFKQIKILSLMRPSDLSFDIENSFLRTLHEVYNPETASETFIETSRDLDRVINKLEES